MNRLIFYKLLIILAIFAGCNKIDLEEPVDGTVVFSASVEVDGVDKNWEAGVDDYYMFSKFEKDPLNVYTFTGRLAKENCQTNCGETLSIHIRDIKQTSGSFSGIGESLRADNQYFYYLADAGDTILKLIVDTVGYQADFDGSSSIYPSGATSFNWDFGDGLDGQTNTPFTNHGYDESQAYRVVTLEVASLNSFCTGSLTKQVSLTDPLASTCSLSLELDTISFDSFLIMTAYPSGSPPFTYTWDNGDSTQSIQLNNPAGQISATVTVTDANGCTTTASMETFAGLGINPPVCSAAFDVQVDVDTDSIWEQIIVPSDSLQFSAVTIEYTDPEGRHYSTYRFEQGTTAYFEIVKVEDYDNNELGQKTKKLTIRFACELWDDAGEKVIFKEGEAVIAVAYP